MSVKEELTIAAVCHNINGSYNCTCKPGYLGDGWNCTGDEYIKDVLVNGGSILKNSSFIHESRLSKFGNNDLPRK